MRFLHTADWHIGKKLYGRDRSDEHESFFRWLIDTIAEEKIEVLLMAGDVFDTTTPGNRALELYYSTLINICAAGCRHIVIIGGNHDSPSLLNAPKELCSALNIHVVGCATAPDYSKEVIPLTDRNGELGAIVCAVPYLRDRDLRSVSAGETEQEKNLKYIKAITEHYAEVADIAANLRAGTTVPVIGMGHLFTAEGKTGDGVRDLYVGNVAHLKADAFPDSFDYIALGHLHVPQTVAGNDHIRYSGSPVAMGFGEAGQQKQVVILDFTEGRKPEISSLDIPVFRELECIEGNFDSIVEQLHLAAKESPGAWVQIEFKGDPFHGNLRSAIDQAAGDTGLEICRVINTASYRQTLTATENTEKLETMDSTEIFTRCMDSFEIPETQRPALLSAYGEILHSVAAEDPEAGE